MTIRTDHANRFPLAANAPRETAGSQQPSKGVGVAGLVAAAWPTSLSALDPARRFSSDSLSGFKRLTPLHKPPIAATPSWMPQPTLASLTIPVRLVAPNYLQPDSGAGFVLSEPLTSGKSGIIRLGLRYGKEVSEIWVVKELAAVLPKPGATTPPPIYAADNGAPQVNAQTAATLPSDASLAQTQTAKGPLRLEIPAYSGVTTGLAVRHETAPQIVASPEEDIENEVNQMHKGGSPLAPQAVLQRQDGTRYLLLPLVDEDLQNVWDALNDEVHVPAIAPTQRQPLVLEVVRQLLKQLESMHEQGNAYRDLKPANVLVSRDGTVLLADWGMVTPTTEKDTSVGSYLFLPPEAMLQPGADAHSSFYNTQQGDVFALGALAMALLTNRGFLWEDLYKQPDLLEAIHTGAMPFAPHEQSAMQAMFAEGQSYDGPQLMAAVAACGVSFSAAKVEFLKKRFNSAKTDETGKTLYNKETFFEVFGRQSLDMPTNEAKRLHDTLRKIRTGTYVPVGAEREALRTICESHNIRDVHNLFLGVQCGSIIFSEVHARDDKNPGVSMPFGPKPSRSAIDLQGIGYMALTTKEIDGYQKRLRDITFAFAEAWSAGPKRRLTKKSIAAGMQTAATQLHAAYPEMYHVLMRMMHPDPSKRPTASQALTLLNRRPALQGEKGSRKEMLNVWRKVKRPMRRIRAEADRQAPGLEALARRYATATHGRRNSFAGPPSRGF